MQPVLMKIRVAVVGGGIVAAVVVGGIVAVVVVVAAPGPSKARAFSV